MLQFRRSFKRPDWRQELKLNVETFGVATNYRRGFRGRGFRGRGGFRGGRGRGRGGGGGFGMNRSGRGGLNPNIGMRQVGGTAIKAELGPAIVPNPATASTKVEKEGEGW